MTKVRLLFLILLTFLIAGSLLAGCDDEESESSAAPVSAWVELNGSASGSGLSGTSSVSAGPAVRLDSSGNPVTFSLEKKLNPPHHGPTDESSWPDYQ